MAIDEAKLMDCHPQKASLIFRTVGLRATIAWICLAQTYMCCAQELPVVSYRFIEDPIEAPRQDQPYLPIPEASLTMLQGTLQRDQVFAVQVVAARANAGFAIQKEVLDAIPSVARSANTVELRRALVSAAVAMKSKELLVGLREFLELDELSSIEVETQAADLDREYWLDLWRKRLQDPTTHEPALVRALDGIGRFGASEDVPTIRQRLESDRRPNVATACCKALGQLASEGLESLAKNRLQGEFHRASTERSIQAVSLLRNHRSPEAKLLLAEFASSLPIAGVPEALLSLFASDSQAAVAIARKRFADKDPKVRAACIETLISANHPEDIPQLVGALRDPILKNRQLAAKKLVQIAHTSPDLVVTLLEAELNSESWQSIEQSTLILTSIHHVTMIPRQLELLDHPRAEVFVTSAWSLRKLVTDENHLATVLEKMVALLDWLGDDKSKKPKTQDHSHQLAHLIETTGEQRYLPATEPLMRLVPKDARFALHARASAVWAIGRIHEGMPDSPALKPMEDRMTDFMGMQPEKIWVRFAAAIAVGRIGNPKSIPKVQSVPDTPLSPPGLGKFWALRKFGIEK